MVRRTGIIVGVSGSGRTQYVYTPEEPVGMDGILAPGLGEPLEMGDWIKFDVSEGEAERIFVYKEKGNFTVLSYHKTNSLFPTTVNDKKGSIELLLENFFFCRECRAVSKKGANMIRHKELGLIADENKYLDKFRIDSRLDIRIARTRQVKMHDTIWAVISANPNKGGNVTRKPLVEVKRAECLPPPIVPSSNVIPRVDQDIILDWRNYKESDNKENIINVAPPAPKKPSTSRSMDLDKRNNKYNNTNEYGSGGLKSVGSRGIRNEQPTRYCAFVTGISAIKAYLWVCDEANPRRSTMYIHGKNNTPLQMGQWIEGDFKRVFIAHEKRSQFMCAEDSWEPIESPHDIDTSRSRDDDGFQMVVVRVNASYSAEKKCMINKYIGEMTDPKSLVPRDIIDREMYSAVITLSKRPDTTLYDWTIERLELASSFEAQCRTEREWRVKSVLESRVSKERRGRGEEEVAERMKNMRVRATKPRSKSRPRSREFNGSRMDNHTYN